MQLICSPCMPYILWHHVKQQYRVIGIRDKGMVQDGWGSQELLPDFELAGRRCHCRWLLLLLPRCGLRSGCCEHRGAALLLLCLPQENVPQAAWRAGC